MRRGSLALEGFARRGSTAVAKLVHAISHSHDSGLDQVEEDYPIDASDLPQVHSSLPHPGFASRNEDWSSVQNAIISIFKQKKLSTMEVTMLCQNMHTLCKSEIGKYIYDFYSNQLLRRGMHILFQSLDEKDKVTILKGLLDLWNNFYTYMLPLLEVVLRPTHTSSTQIGIRHITLVSFRDRLLLKANDIEECLQEPTFEHPPTLQQMLLVLQHNRELDDSPTDNQLQLERLVSYVANPYLGYLGLYEGSPEPSFQSSYLDKIQTQDNRSHKSTGSDGRSLHRYVIDKHRESIFLETSRQRCGSAASLYLSERFQHKRQSVQLTGPI